MHDRSALEFRARALDDLLKIAGRHPVNGHAGENCVDVLDILIVVAAAERTDQHQDGYGGGGDAPPERPTLVRRGGASN